MIDALISIGYFIITSILFAISVLIIFFGVYSIYKGYRGEVLGISEEARFISAFAYLIPGYLLSMPILILAPLVVIGISEAKFAWALSYLLMVPLSIVVPLIIYSSKKDSFIAFHSLQSIVLLILLFSLSTPVILIATYIYIIMLVVGTVISAILLGFVGALYLTIVLLEVQAAWKALKGEEFKIAIIGYFSHRVVYPPIR